MPGLYDHAVINRVQQANDIIDVVGEHVSLKRKGREMVGLCPFHEDHRPSMNVSPTKQIFKCFACGAGGDVLKFIQMREGLSFSQAVERLAERAGIQIKPVRRLAAQTDDQPQVDPNRLAKLNAWATRFFQQCLGDPEKGKVARDYLAKRQISTESIGKWRLGVSPNAVDSLVKAAASSKVPLDLVQQGGLATSADQDRFCNRLMFPITDVTGRVIGFGGRTLNDTGAKYINSPTTSLFDKSSTLYGLEQARHEIVATGTAVIVEGYTDVIMAHQCGCNNVVATLGTSLTSGHGRILRRYAEQVILVFDSDTAGMEAANRALEVCLAQHLDIKLAFVPEGKDPCEYLLMAGKEAFDRVLSQATDVLRYKWNRLEETFQADGSLANKRAALNEFLQAVATGLAAQNLAVLESGLLVNKVAKIIGLAPKEINDDINKRIEKLAKSRQPQDATAQTIDWGQGLRAAAQREILEVLLNEPGLFHSIGQEITEDLFDVPILREIAGVLLDVLRSEEDFALRVVLARTESVQLGDCIIELQEVGEHKGNYPSRLGDALDVLYRGKDHSGTIRADGTTNRSGFSGITRGPVQRQNPHSIGMV
ncbi:MAG: DNA primase [Sedimentisphaerales bacterium]|nr:DNA primase [Sedimentisphaerales bacterium]